MKNTDLDLGKAMFFIFSLNLIALIWLMLFNVVSGVEVIIGGAIFLVGAIIFGIPVVLGL